MHSADDNRPRRPSLNCALPLSHSRYTKYLYPYECRMVNLSSPTELQTAIDGNRREGRRTGYDTYPHLFPPMLGSPMSPHMLECSPAPTCALSLAV